ncbi:MAG: cytochrome c3 family protein [Calditrichia bacterium]
MECHSDPELTGLDRTGMQIPMYVDGEAFSKSVHADLSCVDCHQDLEGVEDYPHEEDLQLVSCANCHEAEAEEYTESLHGLKFIGEEQLAPRCSDCHSKHAILPSANPNSSTYFQNLPNTCCGCHESKNTISKRPFKQPCVRTEYLLGVHGKMVLTGNDAAPTCNTCHPAHDIRKRIDPKSTTYKPNIGNTCGFCHIDELAEYSESIHANALRHGILESATCTDCHGEHKILHPDSAYFVASHDACIICHNDPHIMQKYGLYNKAVSTYEDSYHGLSVKLRNKDAATCGSCHNNHIILSANNPYSTVHENNLVTTCRKCHRDATESFARSYTHEAMLIRGNPVNFWVTVIYAILIVGVIGAMFVHNFIIFLKYVRRKKAEEKQFYVIRFKPAEVFQHAVLLITFTVLVFSGFALRFPDSWWVEIFKALGIDETGRGLVHRVAAVGLILISLYHLYFIIFTQRGRYLFRQIRLRFQDIPEVIQTVQYYLGLRNKKPEYEEFDYTEKAEYWSVVWGTVVMGITGIILWFPTWFTRFAPSWIVRASELIHFYEAILATLAIIVFHLFFVIAHPEQYPMNLSWLTGKMSLRAAIRKHPRWIQRLLNGEGDPELLPEVIRTNCKTLEDIEKMLKFGGVTEEAEPGRAY